eukprot:CAMPEP_0170514956 /NCGR_PEP_ID=MMETSP0209-20121228/1447_1 /TAXON_ID=665100 ORGANISM="Litonotus pictus, Strain P1" /NCGR_SAMPLE_ID=MMETSP0209 /ASSEMBLY_ACC=CAM_ASM_000301 /LENGTH=373 /DNA_ID=CAMNT_0010799231 /DNA_START=1 /DNA_END=1122 /DNA_ORIENTATION=-
MGPKKGGGTGESKKSVQKKQEKVFEDKTFGLKNKNKSKTVQNYIKGVENQCKGGKTSIQSQVNQEFEDKAMKKKLREEEAFLNSLSKTVKDIKQADCSDDDERKNVLCQFFAQKGFCEDGDDCKFSHDLNIEFNQGAFDIYTDLREAKSKLGIDFELMEQREAKRAKLPKTDIVCKFFLEAIKTRVYGFKWQCPNGDDCHYKHCLPKDYVIKSLKGQIQEEMTFEEFHDLEEKIDVERERVAENGTKVTEKSLAEWIERRIREKEKYGTGQKKKEDLLKKLKTGKELFINNKDGFKDDENADEDVYENEGNELEEETKNLQDQLWGKETKEEDKDKVKVDEDLFKEEGNLDDVDLDDEEEDGIKEDPDEDEDN